MVRLLLCLLLVCNAWSATANELTRADNALMRGDYAAAVEILKTLSDDGNATAMTHLASLYHRGEGVPRDIDKAVRLYLQAAELGQSEAQFNLGNMYLLGEGLPQDESWALSFYRLAADQGHELAAQNLRELYRANGVAETETETVTAAAQTSGAAPAIAPVDVQPELASMEPAAPLAAQAQDSATTESPTNIAAASPVPNAVPVEEPDGSGQTGVTAAKPTAARARLGADAVTAATLPHERNPTPVDSPMVVLDPVEAPVETPAQPYTADQSAALQLARAHGIAVDIDSSDGATGAAPKPAAPLAGDSGSASVPSTDATGAGHAARYERVERMLALENYAPAVVELTELAAAGHADSAWRLAVLHARGQGVTRDENAALRWQERAATLGQVDAQFELGEKHAHGRGVAPDEAMAITYYREAARGGHVQAREKLRAIYDAAGLPMPELARRRAPIAITVPATKPPAQSHATVQDASPLAISRRDPIEDAMIPPQEALSETPALGASDEAKSAARAGTAAATIASAPAPAPANDDNIAASEPTARVPAPAPVAAALAAVPKVRTPPARVVPSQPRLSADAIVIHPDRVIGPANADAGVAPAPPANHVVVPGSVLALTSKLPEVAGARVVTPVATVPVAASSFAAGNPTAATESANANNAGSSLAVAVVEPVRTAEKVVASDADSATNSAATETSSVAVVAAAEMSSLAATATPVVTSTATNLPAAGAAAGTVATESGGRGLFKRLAGLFGDPAQSPESTSASRLTAGSGATAPVDSGADGATARASGIDEAASASATISASPVLASAADEPEAASGGEAEPVAGLRTSAVAAPASQTGSSAVLADGKRALAEGDLTRAAQIFTRLAEAGDAEAQAHIGYMYYVGEGVEADLARAVDWYRLAAVQGNRDAQYNLAVAYAFGEGVPQDDGEAAIWYRRAAEQGSAIAQYSLGMSYALGEGVPRDDAEAIKWYRAAAAQDYAAAQYNLGYSYRTGHGVAADEAEAIRWFEAAAQNGHASAQYSLGYMYRSGRGVRRDVDEAIKWYRLAAAQGHPDARADLASLNPGG